MPNRSRIPLISALVAFNSLGALACADSIDIRSGDAVRIEFPTDLRANINRPGDGFYVVVDHDPLVPDGTRLYGRILSVRMATWRRPASMNLEFYMMRTPGGPRERIEAIPVPLNDPHLTRGTNGRLVARYTPGDSAAYTLGGAAGGLLVGVLAHHPVTGTVIGALLGSLAGHENRLQNQDLVVAKGEHMVAVFAQDAGEASSAPESPPLEGASEWRSNEGRHHRNPPSVDATIDIRSDERPLVFYTGTAPYRDGGAVMVPLDRTASQLQLDVTRHSDGRITIDGPDGTIELRTDATAYAVEGKAGGDLPHAVVDHEGAIYVPIEAFAMVKPGTITVDGRRVVGGMGS